jgi:hypothetical protein
MSAHKAEPRHEVAFQEIADLLKRHAGHLSALEILAIAANMVGKLIAMQDQRTETVPQVMKMVAENIEMGNAQVLAELGKTEGSA